MDIQIVDDFEKIYKKISDLRIENKFEELEQLANELIMNGIQNEYTYTEGIGYYALAEAKYIQEDFLECIKLYWKIHFICERDNYPRLYAVSCNLAGKTSGNQGDYHNSVAFFLQGYYMARDNGFTDIESWILNNIGTLFFNLEHYDEAINYFEKAMNLIENEKNLIQEFHEVVIMNIISAYLRLKDFQMVEEWTSQFYSLFPNARNVVISNGMQMKKVLHAYDAKDIENFKVQVLALVEVTKTCWTGNYAIQILLETAGLCYELALYSEMEACLMFLKTRLQVIDYRHRIKLSSLLIKLYRAINKKECLYEELDAYYELTKESESQDKGVEYKGLKNKIVLEREIFAKKKLIEKNEELSVLSEKDPFTGLLNKTSFIKHTNRKLKKSLESEYHVLIIVDVDDFKNVNDTYGHLIGDEVLKILSNSFVNTFRIEDYIGRIGGDEFCIYIKGSSNFHSIEEKAEAIRKEIKNLYIPSAPNCKITASIGICATKKATNYDQFFVMADKALYEAKKKGKNCYYILTY